MQITRAIVTGGSGFIGSHIVDLLVERGVDVTVVDKAEPKYRNDKAKYVIHDIRHDGLNEIFATAQPEVVFHMAAHIDDRASVLEPAMNADHNEIGSLKVFEAARLAQAKKIVFASSCAVYGLTAKPPLTEKQVPKPMTPYAISKLAGENYLHFYQNTYGIPFVAFRIANVYGPRQDGSKESGAIAIFTSKLIAGQAPFINDDGNTLRDYIHVSDVANAFVTAGESEVSGVFNCGTKIGTTTRALFELISSELGSNVQPIARPEVKDAVKAVTLRSTKAKKELGWKPKMRLARGLKQTLKWYKAKV
ncbi:MAG: NAD-dependent epimerase/dehydratase family protein [Patescibacteria group bacterium]